MSATEIFLDKKYFPG